MLAMSENETATINTTALAREYQLTTKDLEKRLRRLGIAPVSEVVMPSGRRFILWPAETARKALDDYRDQLRQRREADFGRVPAPSPAPNPETAQLAQEVSELKGLVSQLLQRLEEKDKGGPDKT